MMIPASMHMIVTYIDYDNTLPVPVSTVCAIWQPLGHSCIQESELGCNGKDEMRIQ